MRSAYSQLLHFVIAAALAAAFAFPTTIAAQAAQHLVSPSDLQSAAVDASQSRQQDIGTLNKFLSIPQAQQAMQSAHVTPQQVKKAVAGMSDEELAQLASRAQKAQHDFAAGMSNHDLILVVLAIVVLILLIALFH